MAKGITDQDVWRAADALLLDGQRPTIERVRQHIGRGSPNTVSPHLDSWFARLGARIADPQVFRGLEAAAAADAAAPEPVQALARQLWDTAQALARGQAESRALDAEALAAAAQAERDASQAALATERARSQALAAELDALRIAHAAEHASLTERLRTLDRHAQASADALADARQRHADARQQHAADLAHTQVDAAQRVLQAERRASADMDRERQARLRAETLVQDERTAAAQALADERTRAQAQFVAQVQALGRMEVRAQALQERLDRVEAERLRVKLRERRGVGVGARLRGHDGK
ncbi:DNA-binding protein [Sphaerotilus sp.]|uniref:DNA-binding protein n=1 Tax=Sphaerotilus sp. TaxID=2093942 RepID=UPI00286DF033|nr:DNA-binding protein [Sphaerotilus sp.]